MRKLKSFIAGILTGALLMSGMVFAKQISENAELFYNNIKIYIDGGELVPKDPNGNIVEPFIYNGTTYLPIRAVSNAFGKDVEWEGETQSIYIGKKDQTKPDNYLDRIQYTDFKTERGEFHRINGTITDFASKTYTNGILLSIIRDAFQIKNDIDNANTLVVYPLNSKYSRLTGNIVIPKEIDTTTIKTEDNNGTDKIVFIYGDDKLIFSNTITASMPIKIDFDTEGINLLTIKFRNAPEVNGSYVALTDLALYK